MGVDDGLDGEPFLFFVLGTLGAPSELLLFWLDDDLFLAPGGLPRGLDVVGKLGVQLPSEVDCEVDADFFFNFVFCWDGCSRLLVDDERRKLLPTDLMGIAKREE